MTDEQIVIPGISGDDNAIKTQYHSLFVTDVEPQMAQIILPAGIGLEEQIGTTEITAVLQPAHKHFTLYLSEFHNDDGELHEILNRLRQADENDTLEVHIGSGGGYVNEGITLFGIMRECFEGRTEVYLDSHAMSMGAMTFGYGERRLAYEYSEIMFHNWAGGAFGHGGNIKTQADFHNRNLGRFFKETILNKGYLSAEEYQRLEDGKEFYFDTYEMAVRGLATDVIVEGYTLPAEDYIEYRDSGFTFDEYKEYKELEAQEGA